MKKWYSLGGVDRWKPVRVRCDELRWAWGPGAPAELPRDIAAIEIAITGGEGPGGLGIRNLELVAGDPGAAPPAAPGFGGGHYAPRWLIPEQGYWTMAGVPDDDNEALLGEDGTLEPRKRGPSFQPLPIVDGDIVSRRDATIRQSLEGGCLPIPTVHWEHRGVTMDIELVAHGAPGASTAYVRYRFANRRAEPVQAGWVLLVQPYQYYPPWQGGGGFAPVRRIRVEGGTVVVDGRPMVHVVPEPDAAIVHTTQEGPGVGATRIPHADPWDGGPVEEEDPHGFAAATLAMEFRLDPGEIREVYAAYPLHDAPPDLPPDAPVEQWAARHEERRREMADRWRHVVHRFDLRVAEPGLVDVMRANIAYNLVTRDGPAFQPGSRSYDKAWMRDGAMAAVALMELGLPDEALAFARWYAEYQEESGEIPPIIDTKAEDPLWESKQGLVEYDSQGEFVWLVRECFRHTGDRAFLEELFPRVVKALEFTEHLRRQRRTPEYRDGPPEKRVFYGILPESTSHEGYHMKHSYWDNYWALRGWQDAREMAVELGRADLLPWMDAEHADFHECVYASVRLLGELKGIAHLPGAAELGDIDPTSSAAAIVYNDQLAHLPAAMVEYTFDHFHRELRQRLAPGAGFRLTPYEFRTIGAFVRMGQKDRALELLRFLLACERPSGWRHFAEVVVDDVRLGTYIGDMPHTWVGAEALIAIRHLFVYDRRDELVLGAGIDPAWLDGGQPVDGRGFSTPHGKLDFAWRRAGDSVRLRLAGTARPPDGFVLHAPLDRDIVAVSVPEGAAWSREDDRRVRIRGTCRWRWNSATRRNRATEPDRGRA
jgi:hypothetical protein